MGATSKVGQIYRELPQDFGKVVPSEAVKGRELFFLNFKRELQALVNFTARTLSEGTPQYVLVFGMGGSGKSSLPAKVQCELVNSRKMDCQLIFFKCNEVARNCKGEADLVTDTLDRMESMLKASTNAILVLDEFDSIAIERGMKDLDAQHEALSTNIMARVEDDFGGCRRFAALLLTNHPKIVDQAIRNRINHQLYLPTISPETVVELIHSTFPDTNVDRIYKSLIAETRRHVLTMRGLANSCKIVAKAQVGPGDEETIARRIFNNLEGMIDTRRDVVGFERKYDALIRQSEGFIEDEIGSAP